jgi:hypothetical protein
MAPDAPAAACGGTPALSLGGVIVIVIVPSPGMGPAEASRPALPPPCPALAPAGPPAMPIEELPAGASSLPQPTPMEHATSIRSRTAGDECRNVFIFNMAFKSSTWSGCRVPCSEASKIEYEARATALRSSATRAMSRQKN